MSSDLDNAFNSAFPTTKTQESNDIAEIDAGLNSQTANDVQNSLYVGAQKDPDRQAKVYDLSKQLKMPVDFVDRNFDELSNRKVNQTLEFDKLVTETPGLAEFLKNPNNAAMSHDDIENLGKIENTAKEHSMLDTTLRNLNQGLADFSVGVAQAPAAIYDAAMLPGNYVWKAVGRPEMQQRAPDWLRNNPVAEFYKKQSEQFRTEEVDQSVIDLAVNKGEYGKAGRALLSQVVVNAPSQLFLLMTGVGGAGKAGATLMGTTTAARSMAESAEKGVDPAQATLNGISHGAIETAFEQLGTLGVLKKWENAIATKSGKETSAKVMQDFAKTMLYSMGAEGNEEALTSLAQDFSSYVTGADPDAMKGSIQRALDAGLIGAASGGLMTGPTGAISANQRRAELREAQTSKDYYLKIGEEAAASKLNQRSGEIQMQFMQSAVDGGPSGTVHIPVEAFETYFENAGIGAVKAANDLGISKNVEMAKTTGNPIEVPMSLWASKLANTEHYKALADHVKFNPEGVTVSEAQKQSEVRREIQAAAQTAEADIAAMTKAEQAQIGETVKVIEGMLGSAGLNKQQAQLARGIAVMAMKAGRNPVEYLNGLNLSIRGGLQTLAPMEGESFNQIPPEIAAKLNIQTLLPSDENFNAAVTGTESASVTPEGLEIDLVRFQKPEQEGGKSVRTGVFYLPKGAKQAKFYKKEDSHYGGTQKIEGKTLLKRPLFAKGGTGGKAPENAFDQINGNGAIKKLADDILKGLSLRGNQSRYDLVPQVAALLEKYGADVNLAEHIVENSGKGNQLRYALQENIIAHAVRSAGYDSVVGWSKGKKGPFISEVFDVREVIYPTKGGDFRIHEKFTEKVDYSDRLLPKDSDISIEPDSQVDFSKDDFRMVAKNSSGQIIGEANFEYKNGLLFPRSILVKHEYTRRKIGNTLYYQAEQISGKVLSRPKIEDQSTVVRAMWDQKRRPFGNVPTLEMFQNELDPNGKITFGKNGINIDILKNANSSTFIHELGHLYMFVLGDLAQSSPEIQKDLDTVLKWVGADSVQNMTVEHHELFARGFEQYIGEGVAPSEGLKKAFRRFKLWITKVYGTLTKLNVPLTDDVREVFDRIMATELERAKADLTLDAGPLFGNPAAVGMNEKEALDYRRAESEAQDAATEILMADTMAPLKKKQTKEYKRKRESVRSEVEKEVNQTNTYKAIAALQKQQTPDGDPLPEGTPIVKLDPSTIPEEQRKQMPRGVTSAKDGLPADVVAPMFGFESGQELIDTLAQAPKKNDLIERETNKRMEELYPDLMNDEQLLEQASMEAQHNDNRAKRLELELKYLVSEKVGQFKNIAKKTIRRVPSTKAVRAEANRIIDGMKMSDVKPYTFERAERKAAREAADAFAKGDFEATFEAKKKELLNHELYRAAVEAINKKDKSKELFKKLMKADEELSKTRELDLIYAARAILGKFGITPPDDTSAMEYLKKLETYDPAAYGPIAALVGDTLSMEGKYNELTLADYMGMVETVQALWDLSRDVKTLEINKQKIEKAEVIGALNNRVNEIVGDKEQSKEYTKSKTTWEKTKIKLMGARAALTRVEPWAQAMGKPFVDYIWTPVSEAVTEYRLAKGKVLEQYKAVLQEYGKTTTKGEILSPELNHKFKDKFELMMAVMHTGNMSNKSKLLRGRAWGSVREDGSLDSTQWDAFFERAMREGIITKADMDFAQNVWNLLESLKPGAQQAHKKMFGFYFNEITSQEIVTPFGNYKGGYIPAKVDVYESEDAALRSERETFEKNNNSFMFPTTGRGFTKNRVDAYAAPLSLDISLLGGHIDGVLRFTHIEPVVKDVGKVIIDKGFRSKLSEVDPEAGKELLIPWLQRAAQQKTTLPAESGHARVVDAMAKVLRRNVAMQIMFGNLSNAMQQVTGFSVLATKVKAKHIRNALAIYMSSPKQMTNDVMEKSKWMLSTAGSNVYETAQAIDKIIAEPTKLETVQEFSKKHTYFLQTITQGFVNNVGWVAAYNQGIEQKMSEQDAVRFADSVIRTTQGTVNAEDISRFEVGTATYQLFTQFAGYFNMLANLFQSELIKIHRETGMRKGAGKIFHLYVMGFMLPAAMSKLIVQILAGQGLDADDDDEYLDDTLNVFFGSQAELLVAMVPWIGQSINAATKSFNDKPYDDRINLSPVINTLESLAGVPAQVYKLIQDKSVNEKKLIKDTLMFLGVATGVPLAPVGKPLGYAIDVEQGKVEPTGPIDFTRGLITGRGEK